MKRANQGFACFGLILFAMLFFQPLKEKLTEFVDRFRAVACMVSTTGRWMLLPVVNSAFYQLASTWKLEADNLRFPLKRQLPYRKASV